MDEKPRYLQIALVIVGIAFLMIYPLTKIWASGWVWQPDQSESLQMIIVGLWTRSRLKRDEH
jgi:hypothetical protein